MKEYINKILQTVRPKWLEPSSRLDAVVLTVWFLLAVIGQLIFHKEIIVLNWFAALWLWVGIFLVRPTMCIPFILMTCPLFMCENRRVWAWVQPVMVWCFLLRLFFTSRFTKKQYLTMACSAIVIIAWSWPEDCIALLRGVWAYPHEKIFGYWLGPQAVWSIFPFRQMVDRALMVVTCMAVAFNGKYFSSRRIWTALFLIGVMAMLASLVIELLPWQESHRFLGTTNTPQYGDRIILGAGYNISFLAMCVAISFSWCFYPWIGRWKYMRLACVILFLPAVFIDQRAYSFASIVLTLALLCLGGAKLLRIIRSNRPRTGKIRYDRFAGASGLMIFLLCLLVVVMWGSKLDVTNQDSRLRFKMRQHIPKSMSLHAKATKPESSVAKNESHAQSAADSKPNSTFLDLTNIKKHVVASLISHDKTRGPMWVLGISACIHKYMWIGRGAGTWARFHRDQPRPYGPYYAHMHNTYLDLMFEYGLLPMLLIYGLCAVAVFKIIFYGSVNRLWLFYLLSVAVMALGQHLLYAFTSMCLLLPLFIIIPKALVKPIIGCKKY